jgi:protein-L-isoaspartate(D-aspartate) O-methyltransferase
MVDTALQRLNMVESQVRPSDVVDRRVIRAMREIPRETFVPEPARSVAYMDETIPLDGGRALLPPRVLAKMIQHLEIEETSVVLDIGCATGYSTSILARLAQTVVALEADSKLADMATAALSETGIDNAVVVRGPLADGYAAEGPYDAILINGAVSDVSASLLDQLKDGGRLVAIQSEEGYGRVKQWRRLDTHFDAKTVFDAAAPVLPGFEREVGFVF